MDRDGEEAPAAKKPKLGTGGGATNDDADTTIVEEHIALGESREERERSRQGEVTDNPSLYSWSRCILKCGMS